MWPPRRDPGRGPDPLQDRIRLGRDPAPGLIRPGLGPDLDRGRIRRGLDLGRIRQGPDHIRLGLVPTRTRSRRRLHPCRLPAGDGAGDGMTIPSGISPQAR